MPTFAERIGRILVLTAACRSQDSKKLSQNPFLVIPTDPCAGRGSGYTSEVTDEVILAGTALLDLEGEIPRLRFALLGMTILF